ARGASASGRTFRLSLHDALPICGVVLLREERAALRVRDEDRADRGLDHRPNARVEELPRARVGVVLVGALGAHALQELDRRQDEDRTSTRLNSSHVKISYAVFCL